MGALFSLAYGLIAYALFLTTFLYAIAFTGNIFVAKSIDTGAPVPLPEALIVNLILLMLVPYKIPLSIILIYHHCVKKELPTV